jgi:hypothetical protein
MRTPLFYLAIAMASVGALQTAAAIVRATSGPAPSPEPVLTVQQFLDHPELRAQVFARCANDPGGTSGDRNCINVMTAERVAMGGGGQIPQFIPKPGN